MLKDLTTLTELHLEKTKVTDKGLENLKGLTNLEPVSHRRHRRRPGPSARDEEPQHVYLWETKVTKDDAAKLKKELPSLDISLGIEDEKPPTR